MTSGVDDATLGELLLRVPIAGPAERNTLRGALLAARATELGQARRRGSRLSFGYGSDAARETMSDEVDQAERRVRMLDRLIAAFDAATEPPATG